MRTSGATTQCVSTPCSYSWRLVCADDAGGSAPAVTSTQALVTWRTGANATLGANTFGMLAPRACALTLTAVDRGGANSTASFSFTVAPGPPLCNANPYLAISPRYVASDLDPTVCAARRKYMTGLPLRASEQPIVAALSPVLDAQGFAADLQIVNATTNRAAVHCGRCNPSKYNCSCMPEVILTGGGAMLIQRQGHLGTGRLIKITFTATVQETGLSATCAAQVCTFKGRQTRPMCVRSSPIERDALTCTNDPL